MYKEQEISGDFPSLEGGAGALVELPVASFQPLALHKVAAGFPSPASGHEMDELDLNTYLVQNKTATFFFTVKGDSMKDAGIHDGDKVVVDRAINPRHGQIVIAVVDSEFTIKRLYQRGGQVKLMPENAAYRPIILNDGQELTIWGVVVGVVRKILRA